MLGQNIMPDGLGIIERSTGGKWHPMIPLRAAGAPDDKTREAAKEIAGFEDRPTTAESDLKLLKWMVGFNLALSMVIVALLLRLAT